MPRTDFFIATLTILACCLGASAQAAQSVQAPAQDPSAGDGGTSDFYVWKGMIPGKPGSMLRTEPVPASIMLGSANLGKRILYSSTNGLDDKTAVYVSGDVFFPKGDRPAGGWPIVAWCHGTTGIGDLAAPSWTGRSPRDIAYLNTWLDNGYAVVASDYQGLGTPGVHPHLAAKPEAYSTLDAVRAARVAFPELSSKIVIVGQSQGAHAALSTALLAAAYAPELHISAMVATGVPNVSGLVRGNPAWMNDRAKTFTKPSAAFGMVLMVEAAVKAWEPDFDIRNYLTDSARPIADVLYNSGGDKIGAKVMEMGLTYANTFKTDPPTSEKRDAAIPYPMPLKFPMPVFMGAGLADEQTLAPLQYQVAQEACAAGSIVELHYYPGKNHSGAVNASTVDSVPFVKKALSGQKIDGNCSTIQPPKADEAPAGK